MVEPRPIIVRWRTFSPLPSLSSPVREFACELAVSEEGEGVELIL